MSTDTSLRFARVRAHPPAGAHAFCTARISAARRTNCGTRRSAIDTIRDTVGRALPASESTFPDVSTHEAFANHSTTAASIAPMHAPYARLSA